MGAYLTLFRFFRDYGLTILLLLSVSFLGALGIICPVLIAATTETWWWLLLYVLSPPFWHYFLRYARWAEDHYQGMEDR